MTVIVAISVKLLALLARFEQALSEPGLISMDRTEVNWAAFDHEAVAVLPRHRLDGAGHILD
jgi:hypothetical protein